VERLLQARQVRRLRLEDLRRARLNLSKLLPFVLLDGHRPASSGPGAPAALLPPRQGELFA
ncbi:MAG: biotin synthase, partial [Roseateles sp.]